MKKILSLILICALCPMIAACGASKDNTGSDAMSTEAVTAQKLSEAEQAAFDYILENADAVLPNHTRYECKGDVMVDSYNCCRFEFYSDEMYLGAVAKAYDEEIMFWDATLDGNYMYMVNNNGWYVTGNYVNAPSAENFVNDVQQNVLDDGISGQYTCNLGSFYITLYEDDYAGEADGYFRAAGNAVLDSGDTKQYSIAGEFFISDEESSDEYKAIYVYKNTAGDSIKLAFSDEGVYVTDKGTHMGDKFNLTGEYLLSFYY